VKNIKLTEKFSKGKQQVFRKRLSVKLQEMGIEAFLSEYGDMDIIRRFLITFEVDPNSITDDEDKMRELFSSILNFEGLRTMLLNYTATFLKECCQVLNLKADSSNSVELANAIITRTNVQKSPKKPLQAKQPSSTKKTPKKKVKKQWSPKKVQEPIEPEQNSDPVLNEEQNSTMEDEIVTQLSESAIRITNQEGEETILDSPRSTKEESDNDIDESDTHSEEY